MRLTSLLSLSTSRTEKTWNVKRLFSLCTVHGCLCFFVPVKYRSTHDTSTTSSLCPLSHFWRPRPLRWSHPSTPFEKTSHSNHDSGVPGPPRFDPIRNALSLVWYRFTDLHTNLTTPSYPSTLFYLPTVLTRLKTPSTEVTGWSVFYTKLEGRSVRVVVKEWWSRSRILNDTESFAVQ